MVVLLGLGNPGTRYQHTRHNIGWIILDAVAEALRVGFTPGKGDYYQAAGHWRGNHLLLVKPITYMNNSGVAALQVVQQYGVSPSDILIIVDELQFPTGRIHLKPSGSSGGHNGLESLIYHLETRDFPRLRCGVGSDFAEGGMADYVLSGFRADETELATTMVTAAKEAVLLWATEGMARAMNVVNTQEREKEAERNASAESEALPADTAIKKDDSTDQSINR